MKCEDYLILIDQLVEDELDAPLAGQVNSHLLDCRTCAAAHENLRQEKEFYNQYFFYVEPPADLLVNIQSTLHAQETGARAAAGTGIALSWRSKISGFFRLYPWVTGVGAVAAGLLILLTINFALWRSVTGKNGDEAAPSAAGAREINKDEMAAADYAALNSKKAGDFPAFDNPGKAEIEKAPKTTGKITARAKYESFGKAKFLKARFSAEKQPRSLKLQNLETETGSQIEKIEFLLRSFRNARASDDGETFDLAYEKQQARKLLARNVSLRQSAESYGTLYAADVLSKAEPMLIEIANLESSPGPEKVLEIKERLRKKNLIVSLQAY